VTDEIDELVHTFPVVVQSSFNNQSYNFEITLSSSDSQQVRAAFLNPPANTVAELATKYVLPAVSGPGKYTKAKITATLSDAARAINRKFGTRWSDGAIDFIAPLAAARISSAYRKKTERAAATYFSILIMIRTQEAFSEAYNIKGTIKKKDVLVTIDKVSGCGMFPFC
jgi:hypothetical protein